MDNQPEEEQKQQDDKNHQEDITRRYNQLISRWYNAPPSKNLVKLLLVLVILAAIPVTVRLAQQRQNYTQEAAGNANPSGESMPVGDLPGWKQIFSDDFTSDVPVGGFSGCGAPPAACSGLPADVKAKWAAYPEGWPDTSKNGQYYPSKVISISNGVMDLYIHTENGVHMVSAPFPLLPSADSNGGMQYGRYVIRFKSDAIPGYKTAWLLWPDSDVWSDGEIDFPEGNLSSTISAFSHCVGNPSQNCFAYDTTTTYSGWHTAVTEWTPGKVAFYLDGALLGTATQKTPASPMHWVIQTETNLDGYAPSDSAQGHVQIDWVAVYVPSNSSAAISPTSSPTPTTKPTPTSSPTPTLKPTATPTFTPTPTLKPTATPTTKPTPTFTPTPTLKPTATITPTTNPIIMPTTAVTKLTATPTPKPKYVRRCYRFWFLQWCR